MKTITAYQCKKCKHIMYPGHLRCLRCNGRDFDQISPTDGGKLLTYTIVNELPWGIDERGRILGIVEFDNGIKAMGVIRTEKIKMGMRLIASWEPLRVIGGEYAYGLSFRPE